MMRALLARELRLAWRSGAEILNPLWFFLIVITLFPLAMLAAFLTASATLCPFATAAALRLTVR
ncbi:hypothetical protein BA903_22815 [Klebsiella pneumoniae]|nr:hypothetical protein BA903_22815 [Klebsiella pneumoniae]